MRVRNLVKEEKQKSECVDSLNVCTTLSLSLSLVSSKSDATTQIDETIKVYCALYNTLSISMTLCNAGSNRNP